MARTRFSLGGNVFITVIHPLFFGCASKQSIGVLAALFEGSMLAFGVARDAREEMKTLRAFLQFGVSTNIPQLSNRKWLC